MQAHVLRTWAADAAAFAEALARQDPRWGAMTFPLADGFGVLCGPGMYVNVAMAVGIERDVTADEFESFEARCARVGVDPAIEVSPLTLPAVRSAAAERGYELSASRSVLRRRLDDLDPERSAETSFVIEPAGDQLDGWRETAAAGWVHDTPARRRASDAFAGAAAEVDGDGFVLARDVESGTTVACASLTIRDDIATLGGMSTVPTARRQGAQSALIRHRLYVAADAGCTLATSTAAPGGDSERNLLRHGFEPWFTIETLARPLVV